MVQEKRSIEFPRIDSDGREYTVFNHIGLGKAEEEEKWTREIELETGDPSAKRTDDKVSSWQLGEGHEGEGNTSECLGRGDGESGGLKEMRPMNLRIAFIRRQHYQSEGEGLADAARRKRMGKRVLANHDALVNIAIEIGTTAIATGRLSSNHDIDHSRKRSGEDDNHGLGSNESAGSLQRGYRHQGQPGAIDRELSDEENPRWSSFDVTNLRLEQMNFSDQVEALRGTDVLVAQYGTGEIP